MRRATVETPFGGVTIEIYDTATASAVLLRAGSMEGTAGKHGDGLWTRATVYAAKLLEVPRIVEVIAARPLDRLLPAQGLVVPHDLVDLTHGHYLTFFEGKGYGFLPQQQPFCPEMRSSLVRAARAVEPTSTARGIFAALDDWEDAAEARQWGAHLAGMAVSPTAFLARELELCYAPLCVLDTQHKVDLVIHDMLAGLPPERRCLCASAMQPARERGLVGDDWRTWL